MAGQQKGAVRVDDSGANRERHPIVAAALLYSAPSFVLRGPIYMVFISSIVGIIYSFFATKDILVTAPMSLQRESVVIQAVGSGLVDSISVSENMRVKVGDELVTVQERIRAAANPEQEALVQQVRDLERKLEETKREYHHKISQLELDSKDSGKRRETELAGVNARIAQIQEQLGTQQRMKGSNESKLAQERANLQVQERLFAARDITLPEIQRYRNMVSDLERAVQDAASQIQSTNLSLLTAKQEKDKLTSLHSEEKLKADLENLEKNRERDVKDTEQRIADLKKRLSEASTLVRGVQFKEDKAYYTSTNDGIVTNLHVKRDQLVSSGAPIVTIVKDSAALEGQVLIENKDIGNLKHGQKVNIKYFAYPYQEYGVQTGVIADIATRPTQQASGKSNYVVKVALDKESITGPDGVRKNLEIGLEAIAEVKTGDKRLIELVFAPVGKFFKKGKEGE